MRGIIAKSNGISFKDQLHKNATTNNNVATSYPSDLTVLTDRIISYVHSSSKKSNHPSIRKHHIQDGDKEKDKDTHDWPNDNEREGTHFAQTEGESPSDDTNQTAAQLLMSGYGNHDDSNLSGSSHFIQVGEVWEDEPTNGSEVRDSDDGLDCKEEADYQLKLPDDPHGLQACVDILSNQSDAADVVSICSSTASSFHDLVNIQHNNDNDASDDDDDNDVIAYTLFIPAGGLDG